MFKVFRNQFPDEPAPPHRQLVRASVLLRVRGAQWFDYVILEDVGLVLGERIAGQGHANLARGGGVLAAGQVQVSRGQIIQIDNASGHYLPRGPEAREAALEAFRTHGFNVPDKVYVEKVWNPLTKQWEPVNASNP